jgi:hypothetical protein
LTLTKPGLDHFGWYTNSNTEGWDLANNNSIGSDNATIPDFGAI